MMWFVMTLLFNPLQDEFQAFEELGSQVLVLELQLDLEAQTEAWFDVAYLPHPEGAPIFTEPGEKVWWIQDRPYLILGATGLPLPEDVARRATVWVSLVGSDGLELGPFELNPRRDGVRLTANSDRLAEKLGFRLTGVDAAYLVQVAHFLVGNLANLDVVGTSYSISGAGTVVNSAGHWVGGRLETVSGGNSTFVGERAGEQDNGGNNNTAVGLRALRTNMSGAQNTALGLSAMEGANGGNWNVAVGSNALNANTGNNNTAIGSYSLFSNTTGVENTAVGRDALNFNETGFGSTAVGYSALRTSADGPNSAFGHGALTKATTGRHNLALGVSTLFENLSGNNNVAVGHEALRLHTGSGATAVGRNAAKNNVEDYTTAVGYEALFSLTSGSGNTAMGASALRANLTGSFNTALGFEALGNITSSSNTAVGYQAGNTLTSGNFNTIVGRGADLSNGTFLNSVAIGDLATATASNQVRLGDTGVSSIGGQVDWTAFSDGRFKRAVREDVPGLDFVLALRPVTYELDRAGAHKFLAGKRGKAKGVANDGARHSGFIAQEVEAIVRAQGFDFSGVDVPANEGTPYGLRYGQFVVPLVKAIQEQERRIRALEAELAELRQPGSSSTSKGDLP